MGNMSCWKDNPILFIEDMLGVKLLAYQKQMLEGLFKGGVNMVIGTIKTREKRQLFNSMRIIEVHDYVAIALYDGSHIIIKDRYADGLKVLNGFKMSAYPYVIPHHYVDKDDLNKMIASGDYKIHKF